MRPLGSLRSLVLGATLTVMLGASAVAGGSAVAAGSTAVGSLRRCSTAVATGPLIASAHPTFTQTGDDPFGVAAVHGYAFVATGESLDVFADGTGALLLVQKITLPGHGGIGVSLTADHRYLLIADDADGADVIDVARAEADRKDALLGVLGGRSPSRSGGGAIEVASSRDGRYAFVSLEDSARIAVYGLATAIADHFDRSTYVGGIPTDIAPVGLAVSPNGRWLYSTSEIARGSSGVTSAAGRNGVLSVISVAKAETDPKRAVLTSSPAGCGPVRVVVSADGGVVWVTARESDELLGFSAAKLAAGSKDALVADVRVGEAPVGLALVDAGTRIVVADSNRFDQKGADAGLTVVSAAAARAHGRAIVGTIRSGLFPREMALEPAGAVLLVGNFVSGTLEAVHVSSHSQDSHT